jgi:dephospho-CoA kinase
MLSVALTGNVASGKSTVAEQWAAVGVPVISADDLSRRAVEPGTPGLHAVVQAFGEQLLKADGTLDRGALGDLVFSDEDARARLESILHPIIWRLRDLWLEERRAEGATLVVSEIPLLFEVDRQGDFDAVVLVDAPDEQRLRRLVESRGIGSDDARRIMAAQMDPAAKRAKADFVIGNDGTPDELRAAAADVLRQLREGRGEDATLRVDLHLHTEGSWDCLSDPEAVLERALLRGLGRIAITDHNQLDVALRMAEAHPDQIIPGEEVKTAEGIDVIGLYLSERIPKGTPAGETIERIREQGGVPYLPHPFAGGKGGGGRLADTLAPLCDVVEVFNARLHKPRQNELAEELAGRHGRLRGAGSDAHTLGELGRAYIVVPPHPNRPEALLAALEGGRTVGTASSHFVHLASTWAKVRGKWRR